MRVSQPSSLPSWSAKILGGMALALLLPYGRASSTDRGVARSGSRRRLRASFIAVAWDGPARGSRLLQEGTPMTAKFPSNALVTVQPVFTESERLAAWCRARSPSCSRSGAPTSRPLPATWKPTAAPAPPSPGGCALSPGSIFSEQSKSSCRFGCCHRSRAMRTRWHVC